jgi:HEAT repeat protein
MSMWREFNRTGVILCAAAMLFTGGRLQAAQQSEHDSDAEAREAAQEQKEAEQAKKEAEQDRLEQMQDLYDQGRDALDEAHYREAEQTFGELAKMNGPQTDAALYWKAYSQDREGKKEAALASIADLKKRFPQSRWKKDAEALEIEMRSSTGSKTNPDAESDDDLKLLALQGLMNNNPEKALPILEGVLNGTASPRVKSKALFVLAQSGSPEAREQMAKIARGQSNPDLQRKAVEYLAIFGGKDSGKTLAEIYASTNDASVKRAVIQSYIISGDREQLAALAKSEPDPDLRKAAIRNLGIAGGMAQLQGLYAKETDEDVKEEILNAYFIGGNASGLIAVAKTEKDPELKKMAVEKLSVMNSKEAQDYLMQLLQK